MRWGLPFPGAGKCSPGQRAEHEAWEPPLAHKGLELQDPLLSTPITRGGCDALALHWPFCKGEVGVVNGWVFSLGFAFLPPVKEWQGKRETAQEEKTALQEQFSRCSPRSREVHLFIHAIRFTLVKRNESITQVCGGIWKR